MSWLITGGAGYIGSHVTSALVDAGEPVVVLDDLSTGVADRIESMPLTMLVRGSVLNQELVQRTIAAYEITGIVHLAAKKRPAESMATPMRYYHENVDGLRVMLECAGDAGVTQFVFSSSAAVYGTTDVALVEEDLECHPDSPYGQTKLVGEWMVRCAAQSHGLNYVNLRYFNVAGAVRPELADLGCANLVPMVFEKLSAGLRPQIFGSDYPTPDGTCIRDYVHVDDVATAHVSALHALQSGAVTALTVNVGRGEGVSVRQMLTVIARVTGTADVERLAPVLLDRRAGDPANVVASVERIHHELQWTARRDLDDMVESAWNGWLKR